MSLGGVSFGLTLSNRAAMFGATSAPELLELAELAEVAGCFDSIWVGDGLWARPRLESVTLLAALAARTRRVKLGVACFSTFPLRHPVMLAYQWASLDVLAEGRTIFVACLGGGAMQASPAYRSAFKAMGVAPGERVARLEEGIVILRRLWSEEHVTLAGRFHELEDVTMWPRPAQRPAPPIWIASNPTVFGASPATIGRAAARVARLGDGWMTTMVTPETFRESWSLVQAALRAEGREPAGFPSALYFNVNVDADVGHALAESGRFLDAYYEAALPAARIRDWVANGDAVAVAEHIGRFVEAGARTITLQLTTWDQKGQLRRVVDQLMPELARHLPAATRNRDSGGRP